MDNYVRAFEADRSHAADYLTKSIHRKTEQQKRLEHILKGLALKPSDIADIACGSGALSYHLSKIYEARFTLVDLGETALEHARETAKGFSGHVVKGDACSMPFLADAQFDLVFFWQTLLAVTDPKAALGELVRICKPGGRVFLSSLFNIDSDVDLYIGAVDHTRSSSEAGIRHPYNVYSAHTLRQWCSHPMTFHPCEMGIDIVRVGRGLGTHTVGPERLQFSGGMFMNWRILEIVKS